MTLRDAKIAYKTYGTLNAARSNAIVHPTWFGGQHSDNEYLIGPGMALDPNEYFIIVPDMFANLLPAAAMSRVGGPNDGQVVWRSVGARDGARRASKS